MTQHEAQKEEKQTGKKQNNKKQKQSLRELWDYKKRSTIHFIRILEKEINVGRAERLFKRIMAEKDLQGFKISTSSTLP